MTRLKLEQVLHDIAKKHKQIQQLMNESGVIISDACLDSYMDSINDGFIRKLIPKIVDYSGAKGIYTDDDGSKYRVHVVRIKSMTEKDEDILSTQRF